jgi:hypothetical protein
VTLAPISSDLFILNILEIMFISFKKIMNKCGHSNKHVIFIANFVCVVAYTKMKKIGYNFGDCNMYILISTCLPFLCSKQYKVFEINILQVRGINHWLHLYFSIFLKLINVFDFLKQRDDSCRGAKNLHF